MNNFLKRIDTDQHLVSLSQFLTFRIARLHLALNAQAAAILSRETDITLGQWRMIIMIGTEGVSTSRELIAKSGMDPAIISRTLRSLERAGFVTLARSEPDRRVLRLALTPSGSKLHEQILPKMKARQRMLLNALSPDEAITVFRIIEKLERAAGAKESEN
ncbi:MAG: MarR family transcriptional regulator [Albidovulum sp.]|nr:MarR family transcriptional regulator [Albidovulum sp.]MDE0530029.1 MarR family transcriptional regulator [Albidovulum sp.]